MALRTKESVGLVLSHRCAEEEAEHTAHLVVEFFRGVTALADGLFVGIGEVVVVVGVGLAHRQSVGPGAELQVKTISDGLIRVVATTPVRNHDTIESPVLFEDLVEHDFVVAVVLVLIEVVGAHDGPCTALLHSGLEGRQVDLVQGAVADDDIHLMTVFLVVVQRIVFHTGCDTFRLQTLNVGNDHAGSKPGILTHILEIASVERCAEDVHARSQHHALVAVERLLTQTLPIEPCEVGVPRRSQTGQRRKGHAGVVGLSCLLPFVPQHVRAHSMRSVVGPEVRESQPLDTRRRELRLGMDDGDLLVECHPLQSIVDALFERIRRVQIDLPLLC